MIFHFLFKNDNLRKLQQTEADISLFYISPENYTFIQILRVYRRDTIYLICPMEMKFVIDLYHRS